MDEIRLALRRIVTRPAAAIASILTLASAIGAASATWSLLSALLLHPLRVDDADTLVMVGEERPSFGTGRAVLLQTGLVYSWYPIVRDSGIFERTTAVWAPPSTLLVDTGAVASSPVSFVVHNFFGVLGISMPRGRDFGPDDDRRGAPLVAVISDRFWRRAFGASDVLGRVITVARKPVTIIGVAPRGFRGLDLGEAPDLFMPLYTIGEVAGPRYDYFVEGLKGVSPSASLRVVGRLGSANAKYEALARLSNLQGPVGFDNGTRLGMMPMSRAAVPQASWAGMTQFAQLLAATVGLLLLAGCATVGMLLLIRTEARREELAVCLALGASRARLAGGVASEGMLLSLAGAVLAIPVSWWLFRSLGSFTLPGRVDIELLELSIDARALVAAGVAAIVAMLVIAVIAGAFGFRADTADALRSRTGATARITRRRTRAVLVVGQVAVAVVLTAGAGLFARSLMAALSLNTGVGMDRVATATLDLEPHGYTAPRAGTFFEELNRRLRNSPQVASFGYSVRDSGMSPAGRIDVDGILKQFPTTVWYAAVDRNYFQTMRMPITTGRDFSADDRPGAPLAAIVSASFGRMLADGGNPLGHYVTTGDGRMLVVGVTSDVVTNVSILEPLVLYMPLLQRPPSVWRTLFVRAAATDAQSVEGEVLNAIRAVDSAIIPPPIVTLEEQIARQMSSQYFGATVLGTLGGISILLTVLGTYSLATSMVQLRAREMGIRAALGAQAWQLVVTVFAETGWLVGAGLVGGFGLAWLGTKTIRAFLFQVQPFDPLTLTGVCALILGVSASVTLVPALRAARVDLVQVLRRE
jgi:predicted permease